MPPQLSSKKSLKSSLRYLVALFIIIIAFFALFVADQNFTIKKIEVTSSGTPTRLNGIESIQNKNSLLLSTDDLQKTLLQVNPNVKILIISKKFPSTIKIYYSLDSPVIALKVSEGFFLLTENGKIYQKQKDNSDKLPEIHYYQSLGYRNYNAGDPIELDDIRLALHFLRKIGDFGYKPNSIDINGVNMIRCNLEDNSVIIFSTEKERNLQDYQFETLVRQFKIEGKNFQSMDFRFEKPIIKLK